MGGPDPGIGRFDLLIGADVLYEHDHPRLLAAFLALHANPTVQFIMADAGRGHCGRFNVHMEAQGYTRVEKRVQFGDGWPPGRGEGSSPTAEMPRRLACARRRVHLPAARRLLPTATTRGLESGCVRNAIDEVAPGGRRRKRLSVFPIKFDCLLDDATELVEHGSFIRAMNAAENQPGGSSHVALILFGPLDDFRVPGAVFHRFDSLIASLTALTW